MKILVSGTLPGRGGIQSHMRFFLRALDEENHEVVCINAFAPLDKRKSYKEQLGFEYSEKIKIVDLANSNFFEKIKNISRLIKDFNPDIVITTGHGMGNFFLGLLPSKKIPRVYFEVMVGDQLLKITDPRRYYKWVYSHFIAQSHTVGLKLQIEMNAKVSYTSLCAFPHIHEEIVPLPAVEERTYEKGKLKVCYFGRLVDYKRPQLLAEEFEHVEDLIQEYHVFGSGPMEEYIEELVHEKGLEDRVYCYGRYPEGEEYYNLLKDFDLLVLPTKGMEGTPLVLMESMACGVPYASCDTGGIKDFKFPKDHSICTERDKDEFIAGVRELIGNLVDGKVSRQNLQKSFIENYSFNTLKKEWMEEINRIVDSHEK